MTLDASIRAVSFGVDEPSLKLIQAALPRVEFKEMPLDIQAMLSNPLSFEPDLIFCGQLNAKISVVEAAQAIRSLYADAPIYYATSERRGFDRKALATNGFTDAFILPMDQSIVRDLISDGSGDFKSVALVDISSETVLDFDTYILLPMNRKYIRFSSAGRAMDATRLKRLKDHEVASVQVSRRDLKKFYDFSAQQLKALAQDSAMSETERKDRMHAAVRSLLTGFLTNTSEMQDCTQIVQSYILSGSPDQASLYEKILRLSASGGDGYAHVANVSALGALIAMSLAPTSVEHIALAGLLHDIGVADVPIEVQTKHPDQRTTKERLLYERHPLNSIALLKARNIQMPEQVLTVIEQHHERVDGTGYPNKLSGAKVTREAQILSVADEFDYLTTVTLGKPRLSPQAALTTLLASTAYDAELRAELSQLFQLPG